MYACVYKDQRQKKNTNTTRDEEKETINTPRQRELNYNKKKKTVFNANEHWNVEQSEPHRHYDNFKLSGFMVWLLSWRLLPFVFSAHIYNNVSSSLFSAVVPFQRYCGEIFQRKFSDAFFFLSLLLFAILMLYLMTQIFRDTVCDIYEIWFHANANILKISVQKIVDDEQKGSLDTGINLNKHRPTRVYFTCWNENVYSMLLQPSFRDPWTIF